MVETLRLHSSALESKYRKDYFRDEFWRLRNGMDVKLEDESSCWFDLTYLSTPSLHLQRISMPSSKIRRTKQQAATIEPLIALVSWNRSGIYCCSDTQQMTLQQGQPLVLSSEIASQFTMPASEVLCLAVQSEAMKEFLPRLPKPPMFSQHETASLRMLQSLCNSALSIYTSDVDIDSKAIEALDRQILEWLALVISESEQLYSEEMRPLIRKKRLIEVKQLIEHQLGDAHLTVVDIASKHGVSTRYLQQMFAEQGTSCREYIRQRRLERAKTLLKSNSSRHLSILDIALSVGFTDASHFSRCFRSAFASTPSECREQAFCENRSQSIS